MSKQSSRTRVVAARLGLAGGSTLVALTIAEVVLRLGPSGYEDAMREFSELAVVSDPRLGHRLRPNVDSQINGIRYRTSSLGTRGGEPEEQLRTILVVGDSVTMGWGVAEEQTWPAQVRDGLGPDVEVINAAVVGWGLEQYEVRAEQLVAEIDPDVLIIGYYPNDPSGTEAVTQVSGFELKLVSVLSRASGPGATAYHQALHAEDSETWAQVNTFFETTARLRSGRELRTVVVLLPSLSRQPYPLHEEHSRVRAVAESHGWEVIDLAPSIDGRQVRDLWVAEDDSHPNAVAHGLYATAIVGALGWETSSP